MNRRKTIQKNLIKFFAVLSGKKTKKKKMQQSATQISESDSDFKTKILKKRTYKKILDPTETCNQYINTCIFVDECTI